MKIIKISNKWIRRLPGWNNITAIHNQFPWCNFNRPCNVSKTVTYQCFPGRIWCMRIAVQSFGTLQTCSSFWCCTARARRWWRRWAQVIHSSVKNQPQQQFNEIFNKTDELPSGWTLSSIEWSWGVKRVRIVCANRYLALAIKLDGMFGTQMCIEFQQFQHNSNEIISI